MTSTTVSKDGKKRCSWSDSTDEYRHYHDTEWGFPVKKDIQLFEKVCLEGFQCGLSWRTILTKRENFRAAFLGFDFNKIARFTQRDVSRLLKDAGIVRHRGKIEAVINNAKMAQVMIKEYGSLAAFFWQFEPSKKELAKAQTLTTSDQSIALSKALKKHGWKFVGPTTMFALMQAMGIINDHVKGCITYTKVEQSRKKFKRPKSLLTRQ
ncbi:MAG: DNA-3-methyladenine glycosylase I [Woeseiaceae bacterium]